MGYGKAAIPIKALVLSIVLPASLMYANAANAVLSTIPTEGVALLSLKVAGGVVGSGAGVATAGIVAKNNVGIVGGLLLAAGGVALGFVDPPEGTFFSGTFAFHYDSSLMHVVNSGWLGSWGVDPTLLPPPVNPNLWDGPTGQGITVALQQPNPNLSVSVVDNPQQALQTISFNWGTAGHSADSTDPFNVFATAFQATKDVHMSFLGDFTQPPSGANLFVSTSGVTCIPAGDTIIRTCGEPTTSFFRVEVVPEPSTWLMFATGLLGFLGYRRCWQKQAA